MAMLFVSNQPAKTNYATMTDAGSLAADSIPFASHMPTVDGFPRPNWASIDQLISQLPERDAREQWCNAARAWMDAMARQLGSPYTVAETENFLMLTPLSARHARLLQSFAENALKQIWAKLDGLAETVVYGKRIVIVFETQETYYQYTAYFYEEGEHPLSAGVFLNTDYGHIAIPFHDVAEMEATVAHELTHCCLRHLPIPLWLNEGLAVTVENELCNNHPLRMDPDRFSEHAAFWNDRTIQEFWNGGSFARVDEGNGLSYELARYCIRALARDVPLFIEFAQKASFEDGGESAAEEVFGGSLGGLIEQFFGPGDWAPRSA